MSASPHNLDARQVARFVDGELSSEEASQVETALREQPRLREAIEALEELREAFRTGVETEVRQAPLEQTLSPLLAAIEAGVTDVPSSLLMAAADGEPLTPPQKLQILRARLHDARIDAAWHAFREEADQRRAFVDAGLAEVSFDGLADRVLAQAATETEAAAVVRSGEATAMPWRQRWTQLFRAPVFAWFLALLITALGAVALFGPSQEAAPGFKRLEPPHAMSTVARVDDLRLEPGYTGEIISGGADLAPVVWIQPETHGMPSR